MIKLFLLAALLGGPSFAEQTKTARPALATPPVMEGCDATDAQFALGKIVDEALQARALEASGAVTVRVFATGDAITQDLRSDRLNLEVGQAGKVVSARCF